MNTHHSAMLMFLTSASMLAHRIV